MRRCPVPRAATMPRSSLSSWLEHHIPNIAGRGGGVRSPIGSERRKAPGSGASTVSCAATKHRDTRTRLTSTVAVPPPPCAPLVGPIAATGRRSRGPISGHRDAPTVSAPMRCSASRRLAKLLVARKPMRRNSALSFCNSPADRCRVLLGQATHTGRFRGVALASWSAEVAPRSPERCFRVEGTPCACDDRPRRSLACCRLAFLLVLQAPAWIPSRGPGPCWPILHDWVRVPRSAGRFASPVPTCNRWAETSTRHFRPASLRSSTITFSSASDFASSRVSSAHAR